MIYVSLGTNHMQMEGMNFLGIIIIIFKIRKKKQQTIK